MHMPERQPDKTNKAKTSYYFDKTLQRKMKFIALMKNKNITDVLEEAITDYIQKIEKEYGEIKINIKP